MYLTLTILVVIVIGIIVKFAAPQFSLPSYYGRDTRKLTWAEIIIGTIIIVVPVILATGAVAANVSVNSKLTKHEYWNGYETQAVMQVTHCSEDGPCANTYDCNPYEVTIDDSYTDSDGNYHSESHQETRYHDCPYTTKEWSFYVKTSLGTYTIAEGLLPENPHSFYWNDSDGDQDGRIPSDLVRSAGYPDRWLAAKKRLDAGHPGPVTQVHDYKNYIMASDQTIFAKWSDQIADYRKRGLMPNPAVGTFADYRATKFHALGVKTDTKAWNNRLETFNAILGSKLQGDMQVVVVDAAKLSRAEAQDYTDALVAEWQAPHRKRDVISKNSVILVLGVSGNTVSWSKAETGMPTGNELLLQKLSELDNTPFTPDAVFGHVGEVKAGSAPKLTDGAVSDLALSGTTKFARVCMECNDKSENKNDSFSYLRSDVHPSTASLVVASIISVLLSTGLWVLLWNVDLTMVPGLGVVIGFLDRTFGDTKAE